MENSILEIKNELIEWIKNLNDSETLQNIFDLKNRYESSLISDINSERIVKDDFDEQFAAGMNSDELLENIAAHLETMAWEESSSIVCDVKAEYVVTDDFDERFAKGLTLAESRKRTREFISNLPWDKK